MTAHVFCGTFEAESHWREPGIARLPALPDGQHSRLVEAMDEMLFAFCQPGDTLLTARAIDDAHADYLHSIGFRFNRNRFDLTPCPDKAGVRQAETATTIFQHMVDEGVAGRVESLCPAGARLEPFAVLPGIEDAARRYGLGGVFPSQAVIREVNTKHYSLRMRDRLGIENVGFVVSDARSLLDRGSEMLERGPVLVKDDYGVSGKGNQRVETPRTLERIARHLTAQAAAGKRVQLVLEPYLQKLADFSCQFRVGEDGTVKIISVHELSNNGLAFGASRSAGVDRLERMEREGYFHLITMIGAHMFSDGYWGDVCVDAMTLQDGALFPLVEINARKSMSLIKHELDQRLRDIGGSGCLTQVSALNDHTTDFAGLLEVLERKGLLFSTARASGILPLTCGTLYPSPTADLREPVKGKLYIAAVSEKPEGQADLVACLGRAMEAAGLRSLQ